MWPGFLKIWPGFPKMWPGFPKIITLSLSLSLTHTHSLFIYLTFSDSLSILWVKGFLLIHYDNWILSKKRHPEEKIKFIVWQIYNFFINCWMISNPCSTEWFFCAKKSLHITRILISLAYYIVYLNLFVELLNLLTEHRSIFSRLFSCFIDLYRLLCPSVNMAVYMYDRMTRWAPIAPRSTFLRSPHSGFHVWLKWVECICK